MVLRQMGLCLLPKSRCRVAPACWELSRSTRRPWRGFCRSSCSSAFRPGRTSKQGQGLSGQHPGESRPTSLPSPPCHSRNFSGMLCPVAPTQIWMSKLQKHEWGSGVRVPQDPGSCLAHALYLLTSSLVYWSDPRYNSSQQDSENLAPVAGQWPSPPAELWWDGDGACHCGPSLPGLGPIPPLEAVLTCTQPPCRPHKLPLVGLQILGGGSELVIREDMGSSPSQGSPYHFPH